MADNWLEGLDVPEGVAESIKAGEPDRVDELVVDDSRKEGLTVVYDDLQKVVNTPAVPQTFAEVNLAILETHRELREDIERLYRAAILKAKAGDELRLRKVQVNFQARDEILRLYGVEKSTVDDRKAFVDAAISKEQLTADIQDALHDAAREAGRSRRDQLRTLQSVAANMRLEYEDDHTGPQEET